MCLVIHSYKTILNCPFARSNNCNITSVDKQKKNYTICGGSVHRQYFLRGTLTMVRPACSRPRKKAVSAALNRPTKKNPDTRVGLQRSNKANFQKLKKLL